MYARKKFDEREAEYSILLRRKLEEAEVMLQHLAPSRSRSIALTKLDEALFWANVGISEAGLEQCYTTAPRSRGFDFDDALATNADGQQVRATRAGDITLDGMKITPDSVENHSALKSGLVTIDHQKLTEIVVAAAQKEATHGKDGAPRHLAELELRARAQKDWYHAMLSYIMGGDSDAKEESKWNRETL